MPITHDSDDPFVERRRYPRTKVVWPGILEVGGRQIGCTVLDLSANGAKVRLTEPLARSAWSGILSIPQLGAFAAQVAWSAPGHGIEIGLTFQAPPAAVALMLRRALPTSQAASYGTDDVDTDDAMAEDAAAEEERTTV